MAPPSPAPPLLLRATASFRVPFVAGLSMVLGGCAGIQSALDPRGPVAASISTLSWILFAGGSAVFIVVALLLAYALMRHRGDESQLNTTSFIVIGGIIWPVVTLSALLAYALVVGAKIESPSNKEPLTIEVIGFQWWWEFRYHPDDPDERMITANELHVPVGQPVELRLVAADVIHTFWVPNLGGKRDLIPGKTNTLILQADRPGLFRGQCNEFCGKQHALMAKYVIAQTENEFARWLETQKQPAREPDTPARRRGQEVFMSAGCADCHQVRGSAARGRDGPDLTHFGSRRTLAAGTLPNTHGNRQAWIASPQHIKPGTPMPETRLDGPDLHALAEYLGSLE